VKGLLWILAIAVAVAGGLLLVRGLARLVQQPQEVEARGLPPGSPLRAVRLFFGAVDHVGLVPEERVILDPGSAEGLAAAVASEVLAGPIHGVTGFSTSAVVRAFYMTPDGTGYLDLSGDLLAQWPHGDGLEWVSVGSLVRSIAENVPAVRTVQILVEGQVVERSPGSIPLDLPLAPEAFGSGAAEVLR
jgi:hypothetical protein